MRVIVTGATSGLGRSMAEALVSAGAQVAITSRSRSRAQAVAAQLGELTSGFELDVRDEDSVRAAVAEIWERLGGVDMLVNNAGIGMRSVNPRFLSDPQPFGRSHRAAFGTSWRRSSPARSWSRGRSLPAWSRPGRGGS